MDALFICFIMDEELKVNILGEDWGSEDLQKLAINMTNQKNAFLDSLNINRFQRKDLDEAISRLSNYITSGNVSGIDFGNYWRFKDASYTPDKAMRRAMEYANSIIAKRGQKPKENTEPQAFNDNGYRDYLINQGYFTKNDDDTLNFNHLGWRGNDYSAEEKRYTTNTAGLASLARTLTDWQTSLKDQEFDFSKSKFKDRATFDKALQDAITAVSKTTVKTVGNDGTEIEEEQAADLTNEERAYLYKLGLDDKVINQLAGIGELQTTPSTWRDQYAADLKQWEDDDARYEANAAYAMREAGKTWNSELARRQTKPDGWDGRSSYAVDLNRDISPEGVTATGKLGLGYEYAIQHLNEETANAYAQAVVDPKYYSIRKTDSQGRFYIPQYTERQDYYIAYDPRTQTVSIEWYYDDVDYIKSERDKYIQDEGEKVMDQQRRGIYTSARYNKEGGILDKLKVLKTGGVLKADKGRILLPYEMGKTQTQQYIDSINKVIDLNEIEESLNNQNAENATKHRDDSLKKFTAEQIAKLEYVPSYTTLMHEIGQKRKQADKDERKSRARNVMYLDAALADLAALVGDVVTTGPVSSLVNSGIGLGSSLTTLTADLMGDETKWYRDFGSFGLNLLGDASVLLPSAIGSAGKASKIGSNLKRIIGYGLSGLGWLELVAAVPHSKEILNSFSKMFQGEKMSVEDWRYIYQGLSAVRTGVLKGTTAARQGKYHTSAQKMQDTYGNTDIVQPKYQITTDKNKKYQLTAEELKQLQGKNTVEEANAYLREVTGDLTAQLKVDSKGKHLIPAEKLTVEQGNDPIQFLKDLRNEGRNPKDKPTITEKTVEYWYTKGSDNAQDDLVELYRRPTNSDTPPAPLKDKRDGGKFYYMKKLKRGGILKCDKGFDFSRYKKDPSNLTGFDLFQYLMQDLGEDVNKYNETNFTTSPEYKEMLEIYPDMSEKLAMTKPLVNTEIKAPNNSSGFNPGKWNPYAYAPVTEFLSQPTGDFVYEDIDYNTLGRKTPAVNEDIPIITDPEEEITPELQQFQQDHKRDIKRLLKGKDAKHLYDDLSEVYLGEDVREKDKYIRNQQFSKTASNLGQFILSELYNKQIHDRNREGIRDKLNADLKASNPFIEQQYYNDDIFNIQAQNQPTMAMLQDQIIQAQNMGQDTTELMNALINMQANQTSVINQNLNNTRQEWQNTFNTNAKSEWQAGLDRAKAFGDAHQAMAEDDIAYLQQQQDNASKLVDNQSKAKEQQVAYNNALIDQYNSIVDDPTLTPEQKKAYINKLKLKGLRIPNNVGIRLEPTWQG